MASGIVFEIGKGMCKNDCGAGWANEKHHGTDRMAKRNAAKDRATIKHDRMTVTMLHGLRSRIQELQQLGEVGHASTLINAATREYLTKHFPMPSAGTGVFRQ